ncbi:MAG: hypothetical protein ACODAU_06645 [Myxococcota bacterium]
MQEQGAVLQGEWDWGPVCPRCGDFAELVPSGGTELCEPCLARIHDEPVTVGAIFKDAMRMVRQVGLPAAVVSIAFELPLVALNLTYGVPFLLSTAYGSTVGVWATGAVMLMVYRASFGGRAAGGRSILDAAGAAGNLIFTGLLANAIATLFTLLLIVPGVLRMLSYAVVLPIVLFEGHTGLDALHSSAARLRGVRWTVLGTQVLALVPIVVVVGITVAAVMAVKVSEARGVPVGVSPEAIDVAGQVAVAACAPFVDFVALALYGRTRHRNPLGL